MLDEKDMAASGSSSSEEAMRDEQGALRPEFIEHVRAAIDAADKEALTALVGELHRADAGEVLEALDPELRPRLIELLGEAFDFAALTEVDESVREAMRDALQPQTVAEGDGD